MASSVPVWVWLPGAQDPVQAAELKKVRDGGNRFAYVPGYLAHDGAIPLDPLSLRLSRKAGGQVLLASDGLAGVLRDAMPSGYGADRLVAAAGTSLTPLQLLERGVPDAVGAIEVCEDIDRKLAWRPRGLEELGVLAQELDAADPSSRAIRRLNDDLDTSAGGDRPKTTLAHDGRLWLAKMQARNDRVALPAREFVTMQLAREAGIDAAPVELRTFGLHQVLLVERFDRAGDPQRPERRLYASAHTVLALPLSSTRGDPARSYLNLADRMRAWMRGDERLQDQLAELWRRMAFNVLVGNVDDHPHNHGLVHDGKRWCLSPAFDITPALTRAPVPVSAGPALALATGTDGGSMGSLSRLISAARHFEVSSDVAAAWLQSTATLVADNWERRLASEAAPTLQGDAGKTAALIDDARAAFAFAEWIAATGAAER